MSCRAKSGKFPAKFGLAPPSLFKIWPELAQTGPTEFAKSPSKLGKCNAKFAPNWYHVHNLVDIEPTLANFGPKSNELDRLLVNRAQNKAAGTRAARERHCSGT